MTKHIEHSEIVQMVEAALPQMRDEFTNADVANKVGGASRPRQERS